MIPQPPDDFFSLFSNPDLPLTQNIDALLVPPAAVEDLAPVLAHTAPNNALQSNMDFDVSARLNTLLPALENVLQATYQVLSSLPPLPNDSREFPGHAHATHHQPEPVLDALSSSHPGYNAPTLSFNVPQELANILTDVFNKPTFPVASTQAGLNAAPTQTMLPDLANQLVDTADNASIDIHTPLIHAFNAHNNTVNGIFDGIPALNTDHAPGSEVPVVGPVPPPSMALSDEDFQELLNEAMKDTGFILPSVQDAADAIAPGDARAVDALPAAGDAGRDMFTSPDELISDEAHAMHMELIDSIPDLAPSPLHIATELPVAEVTVPAGPVLDSPVTQTGTTDGSAINPRAMDGTALDAPALACNASTEDSFPSLSGFQPFSDEDFSQLMSGINDDAALSSTPIPVIDDVGAMDTSITNNDTVPGAENLASPGVSLPGAQVPNNNAGRPSYDHDIVDLTLDDPMQDDNTVQAPDNFIDLTRDDTPEGDRVFDGTQADAMDQRQDQTVHFNVATSVTQPASFTALLTNHGDAKSLSPAVPPFSVPQQSHNHTASLRPGAVHRTHRTAHHEIFYINMKFEEQPTPFPLTGEQLAKLTRPLTDNERSRIHSLVQLKLFLATAPHQLEARIREFFHNSCPLGSMPPGICRFYLPTGGIINCFHWAGKYYMTADEVVDVVKFGLLAFGCCVRDNRDSARAFRTVILDELRQLITEDRERWHYKSPLMHFVKNHMFDHRRKLKAVYEWSQLDHRRLFLLALSREVKGRLIPAVHTYTDVIGEPAFSFMSRAIIPASLCSVDRPDMNPNCTAYCAEPRLQRELPFFAYSLSSNDTARRMPRVVPAITTARQHLDISSDLFIVTAKLADVFLDNNKDSLSPPAQYKATLETRMLHLERKAQDIILRTNTTPTAGLIDNLPPSKRQHLDSAVTPTATAAAFPCRVENCAFAAKHSDELWLHMFTVHVNPVSKSDSEHHASSQHPPQMEMGR